MTLLSQKSFGVNGTETVNSVSKACHSDSFLREAFCWLQLLRTNASTNDLGCSPVIYSSFRSNHAQYPPNIFENLHHSSSRWSQFVPLISKQQSFLWSSRIVFKTYLTSPSLVSTSTWHRSRRRVLSSWFILIISSERYFDVGFFLIPFPLFNPLKPPAII